MALGGSFFLFYTDNKPSFVDEPKEEVSEDIALVNLSEDQIKKIMDPYKMTEPGIPGKSWKFQSWF